MDELCVGQHARCAPCERARARLAEQRAQGASIGEALASVAGGESSPPEPVLGKRRIKRRPAAARAGVPSQKRSFRCTAAEWASYMDAARAAGMNRSDWIRRTLAAWMDGADLRLEAFMRRAERLEAAASVADPITTDDRLFDEVQVIAEAWAWDSAERDDVLNLLREVDGRVRATLDPTPTTGGE